LVGWLRLMFIIWRWSRWLVVVSWLYDRGGVWSLPLPRVCLCIVRRRWSRWWVVSCMSATIVCCYSGHWTQWLTSCIVRGRAVDVQCWRTVQWQRVLRAATSSVSTAAWPIMASHLAASLQVSCLRFVRLSNNNKWWLRMWRVPSMQLCVCWLLHRGWCRVHCRCLHTEYWSLTTLLHRPVLTATGCVNGNRPFSTTHRINIPEPIIKKFGTGDCIHDSYRFTNFDANSSMGSLWENMWNITKIYLFIPCF